MHIRAPQSRNSTLSSTHFFSKHCQSDFRCIFQPLHPSRLPVAGARIANNTMTSIALGSAHCVVMLRALLLDRSPGRACAVGHSAYFVLQIFPAVAASLNG